MLAAEFGVGQVLWSILWFTIFFMWIALVFSVFGDIIRDRSLSGGKKAFWTIFIIVLPYLGVLIYLIARGGSMGERAAKDMQREEEAFRAYVQDAAGGPAQQLAVLADLHDRGKISDAEFESAKSKLVG
jgi:hypothetical protein